jgi:hypothetical protein
MQEARRKIFDVCREVVEELSPLVDEGVMLTGFVMLVETASSDGSRALEKYSSDATGEAGLFPWAEDGICHYFLRNREEFEGIEETED